VLDGRVGDVKECRFLGNHFELIPMVQIESQHSTDVPTCHDFPRFVFVSQISQPVVESRWRFSVHAKVDVFFGKKAIYGQFSKNLRVRVIYLTKKIKILAHSPALASAWIAPKICHGQLQIIYSDCPKFHPNLFTSDGVIAGSVNIVETRHKVFPIGCW